MKQLLFGLFALSGITATAQVTPEISSWIINVNNATGYGGLASNVQQVAYTTTDVYVSATCIPGYDIGPWAGNPNTPANQNFCFKITRNPVENTGTKTATPLGHIGVWTNGVSIFNAKDAFSYNNQGIWNQNAYFFEGSSFDDCLGHPAPNGEYHHHVNPSCLYNFLDDQNHSPIIGYAFDGFPIYGAYAYEQTNGTGGIVKMQSSYQLRNISDRTTLPNGTVLAANQYGPAIGGQYPLGAYLEDYEFVNGSGHLDAYNGRFCITPDYPQGTYAYFVTLDAQDNPAYPYTLGLSYYGTVQSGNIGPQSGHNTVPGNATVYTPASAGIAETEISQPVLFPNPATEVLHIQTAFTQNSVPYSLYTVDGILKQNGLLFPNAATLDISTLQPGAYVLHVDGYLPQRFIKR